MRVTFEYELNRAWVTDDVGEIIGETNYVVSHEWFEKLFNDMYANKKDIYELNLYDSLEEFLDLYEPETDGEFIYQQAIKDGVLVEDFGVVMY